MKFAKRTLSVLLALLLLATVLPLSVYAASLKITTQPKTSYTEYGATAKATIKATGDGLKYTWYIKNAGASKYSKSSVTKSTYSTTMNDKSNGRYVYCVVKDKKGKTVKSSTAILRMKATVTTEPKTTYAKQGATAKLTVKAKGDGLKYTWYIKNAGKTKYSKSSVTKSTYSVTMSDKVHGRYVYCVVTDKYGKTDKSKTVVLRQQATITTQPKNTTVAKGETAKLTVKAKGDGLKYQWYIKNAGGTKYSKSSITSSTYSVKMSDKVHGRYVYCIVTDKYGKTDKSKTVVLKQKADPLTIVTQPADVTCKLGDIATFTVQVAGGKAPYTYQWQCCCEGDGDFWWDIEEDMDWAGGYNTPSLGIEASLTDFVEVTKYRCIITDAAGNQVISNEVDIIEDKIPLTITLQPEDVTAKVGDQVGFGVMAEGGKAPYTYQWQCTCLSLDGWQDYVGETIVEGNLHSLLVQVSQQEFDDQYRYRCVITDANGDTVISNEVAVIQTFAELAFNVPPQTVTARVGDEVSFYPIVEGGKAPYTYQWQIKGALGTEYVDLGEGQYQGVTEDYFHFVVGDLEFDNGHTYRVIVTDALGNQLISDPVWVEKAEDPLTITAQPRNVTAKVGDTVSFFVAVAGGTDPYTYTWQYKSNDFDWNDIIGWADGNDATLSFPVDASEFERGYQYRCVITDAEGNEVITEAAWVEAAPLTIVTQPQNVTAKVGDEVSFLAEVEGGKAPYTYQWEACDIESDWYIVAGGWAEGANTERMSFVVDSSEFEYGYQYRCVITDAEGNKVITEAAWVIEVIDPFIITAQPVNDYGTSGGQCTFSVLVSGGKGPYSYQWQWSDYSQPWQDLDSPDASGEQTNWLDIIVAQDEFDLETKYRCVITDANGQQLITNAVWVVDANALRITKQPKTTSANVGEFMSFSVQVAGGTAPYTYKWQYTHDLLGGWQSMVGVSWAEGAATDCVEFDFEQTMVDYNYYFRCVITDKAGNTITTNAVYVIEGDV